MLWNHINRQSSTRTEIFSKSLWSQMSFREFTMRCIHVPLPTWEWISQWGERETQQEWSNQRRRTTYIVCTFIGHILGWRLGYKLCLLYLEPYGEKYQWMWLINKSRIKVVV